MAGILRPFNYISDQGLYNLKDYKYSAEDRSLLVKYVFRHFWNFIVDHFVPIWMAPNLITAIGFSLILFNFFTLCYYDPLFDSACPSWVYFSWGLGIFLYQLLDNIDGKQARKTGTSSPLGEIFDHGCDSLFAVLSIATMNSTMAMTGWHAYTLNLVVITLFYASHWEEWYTGKLILTEYGNPTESQLWMCLGHFITYAHGREWWHHDIVWWMDQWFPFMSWEFIPPEFRVRVSSWSVGTLSVIGCLAFLINAKTVYDVAKERKIPFIKTFAILVPLFQTHFLCTTWWLLSPADLMHTHPLLCICTMGLLLSYMLDMILLARITKTEFNIWNPLYFLPSLGLLNILLFGGSDPLFDYYTMLVVMTVLVLAYAHMVVCVILELCNHLNIYCFKIPYPKNS